MTEFMTVEALTKFGAMVLVVALFVQFTKSIIKGNFPDEWVRLYAFIIALIIVFVVYSYQGLFVAGPTLGMMILLAFVNALIVSLAAMGGYAVASGITQRE